MGTLFEQLKRRNVFRAAATYLALSWVLLQVIDLITPILGLPDSLMRLVTIVLLLGFIPVVVISWVYEITPDGLKKESQIAEESLHRQQVAGKMNTAVVVLIIVAIGLLALDRYFAPSQGAVQNSSAPLEDVTADDGRIDSIAVLPFADFSAAGDRAYLGDGIADTVLHMLAGVQGLRVAARTSSFSFREKNADIATIGAQLNVEAVLEGSVQVAGDQLRIIAQLIRTSNQSHIWSQTFDRNEADIFAIQDEIANAVVAQFARNDTATIAPIASHRTSPEVYALVLQARQLTRGRNAPDIEQAIDMLRRAILADTTYASAHSEMAAALLFSTMYGAGVLDDLRPQIEAEIEAALRLDPKNSNAYAIRGALGNSLENHASVKADFEKALELNPSDVETMAWLAEVYRSNGDTKSAQQLLRRAYETDPLNVKARADYSLFLIEVEKDIEAAIAVGEETVALNLDPGRAYQSLALLYMRVSRLADVAFAFFESARYNPQSPNSYMAMAFWMTFMDERDLAEKWLEVATELRPQFKHSQDFFFRDYLGEAGQLLAEFETQLEKTPDSPSALAQVSITAAKMGNFEQALNMGTRFEKAVAGNQQINPRLRLSMAFSMAIIHRKSGRQEESARYVDQLDSILIQGARNTQMGPTDSTFADLFLAMAKADYATVAQLLENLEVGGPIIYGNMKFNALYADSHANPRISAWIDGYTALIEREREKIKAIKDPAFWNPRLLTPQ